MKKPDLRPGFSFSLEYSWSRETHAPRVSACLL
jgi:hypothetical protein